MGRLTIFLCVLSLPIFAHLSEWSDSGIFGPRYSDLLQITEHWKKEFPDKVTLISYGQTPEGRVLRMALIGNSQASNKRPALVLTGSTHGNEYLNLEDRIPRELLTASSKKSVVREFLEGGGVFVVVPVLNPDGYDHRKRENAGGIDLNRDWEVEPAHFQAFRAGESRALRDQLDKLRDPPWNLDYRIAVDYHCCAGALLTPWSYTGTPMPIFDKEKHAEIEGLAKKYLGITTGTTGDVLGYFPLGTTKDFYYSRYHALSFTYEGRFNEENLHLNSHVKWWESMVSWVVKETVQKPTALFAFFGRFVP